MRRGFCCSPDSGRDCQILRAQARHAGLFSSTELRNRILEARCRLHLIFGVLLFQLSSSAHKVITVRNMAARDDDDIDPPLMPLCVMPNAESSASLHHFNNDRHCCESVRESSVQTQPTSDNPFRGTNRTGAARNCAFRWTSFRTHRTLITSRSLTFLTFRNSLLSRIVYNCYLYN